MDDRTYRVRRLPGHLDRLQVVNVLVALELGPAENVQVLSLAPVVNPWERPITKVATVTFNKTPSRLAEDRKQWTLPARQLGHEQDILIDLEFLGFTVLNEVERTSHLLDCVAISGLASHPFGSWRHRGSSTQHMWLRDQLPIDMPSIRSIIYGYKTDLVISQSFQTIDDLAIKFIAMLKTTGRPMSSAKPLVFIAHSLGGVILKRALVVMANSTDADRAILQSIKAIICFGVPSQGMHVSHLLAMVEGQPNEKLIHDLSPDSALLRNLELQFTSAAFLRDIRLLSIYETKRSEVPERSPSGEWRRNGSFEVLVKPESAIQTGTAAVDVLPVDEDHSNIVKFEEDNMTYKFILVCLSQICAGIAEDSFGYRRRADRGINRRVDQPETAGWVYEVADDTTANHKNMMESLYQESNNWRFRDIERAHRDTLDWVLQENGVGLIEWLQYGQGLYWIQGKPGSGKSTMMKHLQQHALLRSITRQSKVGHSIYANFFFHARGAQPQKTLPGLLQSLLVQVLSKVENLQDLVLPIYLRRKPEERNFWPLEDLSEALNICFAQAIHDLHVCILLDALDEFDGPMEFIVGFLKDTVRNLSSSRTSVQICFSSRPWNVFINNFSSVPGFKLHEHTQADIRRFALSRLNESTSLSRLVTNGIWLERIVKKAQGVFLWVALTIKELIADLNEGISATELERLVESLPKELEGFYDRIILSIPSKYLQESYIIFETLLRYDSTMSPDTLMCVLACAPFDSAVDTLRHLRSAASMVGYFENTQKVLYSRCGGLIEIVQNKVQFMHQTVKEFVNKPGFQQRLMRQHAQLTTENGYSFVTKFLLTFAIGMIQQVPEEDGPRWSPSDWFDIESPLDCLDLDDASRGSFHDFRCRLAYYCHMAELSTSTSMTSLFDTFSDLVTSTENFLGERFVHILSLNHMPVFRNPILMLAVLFNLQLYVRSRLVDLDSHDVTLLSHCIVINSLSPSNTDDDIDGVDLSHMLAILLATGASLRAVRDGRTAFQTLLMGCRAGFDSSGGSKLTSKMERIAEVLLSHGQDPNVDILLRRWPDRGRRNAAAINADPRDEKVQFKGLHVVHGRMLRLLLAHDAEVNALNWEGYTPLDICLGAGETNNPFEFGYTRSSMEAIDTLSVLVSHGGKMTVAGRAIWQACDERLMTRWLSALPPQSVNLRSFLQNPSVLLLQQCQNLLLSLPESPASGLKKQGTAQATEKLRVLETAKPYSSRNVLTKFTRWTKKTKNPQ